MTALSAAEPMTTADTGRVLVFAWVLCIGDNHRLIPAKNRRGLVASQKYRRAKDNLATVAAYQWGYPDTPMLRGDVCLTARCWFPDRRKRDAGNYRKAITDALTGICYGDDAQLVDERWVRAGFDKADPRIEVRLRSTTISAAAPGEG